MDSPQYFNLYQRNKSLGSFPGFKPYYKWIVLNT